MDTSKLDAYDHKIFQQFSNPSLVEKDLQTLVGIIQGIKSDSVINKKEHSEVIAWINAHKNYEEKQPYKEVIGIIRQALSDNILTNEESESIIWFCNLYIKKTNYFDILTSGIQKLTGIVKGIAIDNEINIAELEYLDQWLEENDFLKNTYPYDELYNLTTSIIQDNIITAEEHEALMLFCKAFIADTTDKTNTALLSSLKTGFYQIDPTINIQEHTFCITGVSKKFKRREIAEKIELYGGFMMNNVSSKLNYLVVCDEKNTLAGRSHVTGEKLKKQLSIASRERNLLSFMSTTCTIPWKAFIDNGIWREVVIRELACICAYAKRKIKHDCIS